MGNPVNSLKDKILGKKTKSTSLTPIIKLIRELGCFTSIIGSEYEVFNSEGELIYTIKQKPISLQQLRVLGDELYNLEFSENESNKNNKLPKKGKR